MTTYRNASLAELETILGWAAAEGWNPGQNDAAAFFEADPRGFFVAAVGDEVIAGISVVNHNDAFAFLGLYIVRPEWRGQGIGYALWQHALAHAGGRTVGLDGVPDQQANYAASGFVHAGETARFSGRVEGRTDPQIRGARAADISVIAAREAKLSGQPKPGYLGAWLRPAEKRQTLVLEQGGEMSGFCTMRACQQGCKIGPLHSRSPKGAEALLRHAATVWGAELTIDVPGGAGQLTGLCQSLGMSPGFETARMYRGPFEPASDPIFAVTSLELG